MTTLPATRTSPLMLNRADAQTLAILTRDALRLAMNDPETRRDAEQSLLALGARHEVAQNDERFYAGHVTPEELRAL